jgi:hypothetical protein
VVDCVLERLERRASGAAFRSRQGDVRVIRASFGEESAGPCGCEDVLVKREQFRRERDTSMEDASAREEAEAGDFDRDGCGANLFEAGGDAGKLPGGGCAQELEGHVPAFGLGPAEIAGWILESLADLAECTGGRGSESDSDKEAHRRQSSADRHGRTWLRAWSNPRGATIFVCACRSSRYALPLDL